MVQFNLSFLACPLPSHSAPERPLNQTHRYGIAQECEMPWRHGSRLNRMRSNACDSPVDRWLRPGHLMRANRELSTRKSIYFVDPFNPLTTPHSIFSADLEVSESAAALDGARLAGL